uniref:hillarin-like isoform X2 n=1 Tax=Ciona intestinalis TaxID=7719 RepID=UPI000EF46111|nr:hillarin-like isoform X2 [Ciona intestinalis]|eukprot:XP_026694483.1 hillarin-like isoform X2 [Ciona intestinalis]
MGGSSSSVIRPDPPKDNRPISRASTSGPGVPHIQKRDVAVACNNLVVKSVTKDELRRLTSANRHSLTDGSVTDNSESEFDGNSAYIIQNASNNGEGDNSSSVLVTCNRLMVYFVSNGITRDSPVYLTPDNEYDEGTQSMDDGSTGGLGNIEEVDEKDDSSNDASEYETEVSETVTIKNKITITMDFTEEVEKVVKSLKRNEDTVKKEKIEEQKKFLHKLFVRRETRQQINAEQQTDFNQKSVDLFINPNETEAPKPEEPVTKKKALYSEENTALFSDLEKYAISVDKVTSSTFTFADLMEELFIGQLTDLEKVRILFHWITSQDLNAIEFEDDIPEDTPLFYLRAIKQEKGTYPALFLRLCGAAGLHAKTIKGYVKGVGYHPDHKFGGPDETLYGSWNGVLIDGQWRLIDTHWGSRHIIEDDDLEIKDWNTKYRYEEHYFLTDPDQLISTHFPDDVEWQLLRKPVTLQQFNDSVRHWPIFYKLQMKLKSHDSGVVLTDEYGFVRILIEPSKFARTDAKFKAILKTRDRKKEIDRVPLNQYILQYSESQYEVFEIYIPTPGKYQIRIQALSKKFSENSFTCMSEYQINCSDKKMSNDQSLSAVPPFPNSSSYYGPGKEVSQLNMTAVSHKGPVVQCDENGEAKAVLQLPKGKVCLKFTQSLFSVFNDKDGMKSFSVHTIFERNKRNVVVFRVRAPTYGNYCLMLYQKTISDAEDNKPLNHFCSYLVVSQKQKKGENALPFPDIGADQLGKCLPNYDTVGLSILSHSPKNDDLIQEACIDADSTGQCFISFSHQEPLSFSSDLLSAASLPNMKNNVLIETTGQETVFRIKIPASNPKLAPVVLMVYAARSNGSIPGVYKMLINCSKVTRADESSLTPKNRTWGINLQGFKMGLHFRGFQHAEPEICSHFKFERWMTSLPVCSYKGGNDVKVCIGLSQPMVLQIDLIPLGNEAKNSPCDKLTSVQQSDSTSATFVLRVPYKGWFSVNIFGRKKSDDTGSLPCLGQLLITASQPSRCTTPFPV